MLNENMKITERDCKTKHEKVMDLFQRKTKKITKTTEKIVMKIYLRRAKTTKMCGKTMKIQGKRHYK